MIQSFQTAFKELAQSFTYVPALEEDLDLVPSTDMVANTSL